jgi:chorismate mutase
MQEIASVLKGSQSIIMVKNPINPDIELWIGAIERLKNAGRKNIAAIHRGFSSTKSKYRNIPKWEIPIELRRQIPQLEILCDPSHIGGKRAYIHEIAQHALNLDFDGLMIESHVNPDQAWTDAAQQLTPADLKVLMGELITRNGNFESSEDTNPMEEIRQQIDEVDRGLLEILSRRMHLVEKIGSFKKQTNVAAFQLERWQEIIASRPIWAKAFQLNPEVVVELFRVIHEESIRKQTELLDD